jgi:uncharacterized membrane protein
MAQPNFARLSLLVVSGGFLLAAVGVIGITTDAYRAQGYWIAIFAVVGELFIISTMIQRRNVARRSDSNSEPSEKLTVAWSSKRLFQITAMLTVVIITAAIASSMIASKYLGVPENKVGILFVASLLVFFVLGLGIVSRCAAKASQTGKRPPDKPNSRR